MTCEELLAMLNEYVDGTIAPEVCDRFRHHLDGCNPCQVVVDNIRKTITLYKEGQEVVIPIEFKKTLQENLRKKWREMHGETPSLQQ